MIFFNTTHWASGRYQFSEFRRSFKKNFFNRFITVTALIVKRLYEKEADKLMVAETRFPKF